MTPVVEPKPRSTQDRLDLAQEITERAMALHRDDLLACGVYGSTGRGTDAPFSDLEMLCVLEAPGYDHTYEWCTGPWKAEVNFQSKDLVLKDAITVEGTWSLTHGSFVAIRPQYDPSGFFNELKQAVFSPDEATFHEAIREAVVGELYEWIAKLRNAQASGRSAHVPELALNMAKYGAFIIGLAHKHLYTSGTKVFEEVFTLSNRPSGFDQLCQLAIDGTLSDRETVYQACEYFWQGVVTWTADLGISIVESRRIPF